MFVKGTWFYLFLLCICSIIFLYSKSIILFILIELIIIFVLIKVDYKYGLILCVVFVFFTFYKVNDLPVINKDYIDIQAKVIEAKEKYIIVSHDKINYLVYLKEDISFIKNDIVNIKGQVQLLEKDLDIDVFEFTTYLNNKRVFYSIDADDLYLIESNPTLSYKIINYLTKNLTDSSYNMTNMLLFNDKTVDVNSYENLKKISAVHLFVVSGFHISFMFNFVEKIFRKHKNLSTILGVLLCFIYLFILDFSISAFRAVISISLAKLFSKHLNSLDCMSISGIILLLIEPLNVYSYSFIMSFLITFVIIITSKVCNKYNKLVQSIFISLICFLAMIPIQLMLNYEINMISMITNFLLSYVVIIIFIMCIIGMILSFLNGDIFGFIYDLFNKIIETVSLLNTSLLFGAMPLWVLIIYYIVFFMLIYFLERKKKIISISFSSLLVLILICLYNRHYLNPFEKVTFLNVNQGDCIIIQDSFSDDIMLIDTGGNITYDIASKKIIPYLNYNGIKDIDIIVITHDDYDHNGALKSLVNQIEVKQIIDDNKIKTVTLNKITLQNLNVFDDEFADKNDNSIVLFGNIGGFDFIFTGDISKKVEQRIIDTFPSLDVDILKVSHHGSKTSTSDSFIEHITPTYSIISVGKNNFYGHPNKEVIDTLNKYESIIYRTDTNGTIRFIMKNYKFYFIETAK